MMTLPRRPARWDRSVPLLRTPVPLIVLQDRRCSVHAADAFWRGRGRLCAVKVKLTMRLGIAARLLVSAHSILAGFPPGSGEVVTQAASDSLVVARGGVGMPPGFPVRKTGANEGGLSQSPPFFFGVWRPATIPCLHGRAKPPNGAQSLA